MNIKKVIRSRGITINLGNYESERFDVTVEAKYTEAESVESQNIALEEAVNKELALGLWDQAEESLKYAVRRIWQQDDNDARFRAASNASVHFRKMHAICPSVADELLGELLAEHELTIARAEAAKAAEAALLEQIEVVEPASDDPTSDANFFVVDGDGIHAVEAETPIEESDDENTGFYYEDGNTIEPDDEGSDEDLDDDDEDFEDESDEEELDEEETADGEDGRAVVHAPVAVVEVEAPNSGLN